MPGSIPSASVSGRSPPLRCNRLWDVRSQHRPLSFCGSSCRVHARLASLPRANRRFPSPFPVHRFQTPILTNVQADSRCIGHRLAGRVPYTTPGKGWCPVVPSSHSTPLRRAGIVWYRNDLRLHDHEAMMRANGACTSVLPVYCFDPREYRQRARGRYQKTGPYRAGFTIDAVSDLRGRLQEMGSDLMVVMGKPEEVIPALAKKIGASAVYCHTEVTYEETKVEEAVKRAFLESSSSSSEFYSFWTNTLHHVDDVPGGADLEGLPKRFDEFKREMEGVTPKQSLGGVGGSGGVGGGLRGLPLGVSRGDMGEIPTLEALGMALVRGDEKDGEKDGAALGVSRQTSCRGGESEALRQLRRFVGSLGGGTSRTMTSFSGNIAPWLASGCLSPRKMLEVVMEEAVGEDTLKWIRFELLYRDFFKLITKRAAKVQAAVGGCSQGRRGCMMAS